MMMITLMDAKRQFNFWARTLPFLTPKLPFFLFSIYLITDSYLLFSSFLPIFILYNKNIVQKDILFKVKPRFSTPQSIFMSKISLEDFIKKFDIIPKDNIKYFI